MNKACLGKIAEIASFVMQLVRLTLALRVNRYGRVGGMMTSTADFRYFGSGKHGYWLLDHVRYIPLLYATELTI